MLKGDVGKGVSMEKNAGLKYWRLPDLMLLLKLRSTQERMLCTPEVRNLEQEHMRIILQKKS